MILGASDWQIATWKEGNNRLTLKFILQTVHYACSDVRWGEYFGTELYSMMSLSFCVKWISIWKCLHKGKRQKTAAGFILSGKSEGKLYCTITEAYPKSNFLSTLLLTLRSKLISFLSYFSEETVIFVFGLTIKLIAYCKTKSKPFSLHTDTLHGLYCKSTYHSGENTDLIPCFSIRWQSGDWLDHSIT